MRLKGWHSQRVEIEIDEKEVLNQVIGTIRKKHELTNVDALKDGRMVEYCEYATSHSWISKEDRGVPTDNQKRALEVIAWLKENA